MPSCATPSRSAALLSLSSCSLTAEGSARCGAAAEDPRSAGVEFETQENPPTVDTLRRRRRSHLADEGDGESVGN